METITVAVISDLHASELPSDDTYVHAEPQPPQRGQHPLADLFEYVEKKQITADYVVCPGDLANRADDAGKIYAWERLNELAKMLGARRLLATPGNHDLTTYHPVPDAALVLKRLKPSYPTGDPSTDKKFWNDGYVIITEPTHRWLLVNSCVDFPAHPGTTSDKATLDAYHQQLERGGFPEDLQTRLEVELGHLDERNVNIAICHHHPREHEQIELFKDDYGAMRRGDELLRVLEENHSAGRWLLIHGHKHVPQLIGSAGTSANSPILLCSASAGGRLWHPVVTVTKNEFHLISIETQTAVGLARLRGQIQSHMWGFGAGWAIASRRLAGLPALCGFGMSHDHRDYADSMLAILDRDVLKFASWDSILSELPGLQYQGPRDYDLLEEYLDDRGLFFVRDPRGNIRQVAKES